MTDRTPLKLLFIVLLVTIAAYINLDFFSRGYVHAAPVTRLLSWHGQPEVRSLELRRGLDLQGGLQVLLQAAEGENPTDEDMSTARRIIQSRVDTLGVTEARVQRQGEDKIVVELPGVRDPELAVQTIGSTARLEFIFGGDPSDPMQGGNLPQPNQTVTTTYPALWSDLPEAYKAPRLVDLDVLESLRSGDEADAGASAGDDVDATDAPTGTYASRVFPTIITGEMINTASVGVDSLNSIAVNFTLSPQGGRLLREFTKDNIGMLMPITKDGVVISSPVVQATIASDGQITGTFTEAEAEALVVQLESGSLPVELEIVGRTAIGPTLGRQSVQLAVLGGIVGMLAVIVFMILYYRVPGVLASVALLAYALFTLALFRVIPVTLTLAGIAGFVLSIGMAVDANILIFERMKEELRAGRRMRAATDIGFDRAWPSIRDSNLSTLITCTILFWFGSQFGASIVKGFAVTLAVGVVTSMFTAIVVTRTFLDASSRYFLGDVSSVIPAETPRLRALFGF